MSYRRKQEEILEELKVRSWQGESPASTVAFKENFATDSRLCLTFLTFPPAPIKDKLSELIEKLKVHTQDQAYFYPPESLHVTIQNVRSVSEVPAYTEEDIERAKAAFRQTLKDVSACADHDLSLEFSLEGLLCLPGSLSAIAYADQSYPRFILRLRENLERFKIKDNKKYISDTVVFGNCTLARFSRKPDRQLLREVEKIRQFRAGAFRVKKVQLVTTNAVCHQNHTIVQESYNLPVNK